MLEGKAYLDKVGYYGCNLEGYISLPGSFLDSLPPVLHAVSSSLTFAMPLYHATLSYIQLTMDWKLKMWTKINFSSF